MKHLSFITTLICIAMPLTAHGFIPSDPFAEQDAYDLIGVYDGWNQSTGASDVVVAVIDNGFDHFHPELTKNTWRNTDEIPNNGIDDDQNGYIDDIVGWNFLPFDIDDDGEISEDEAKGNNDPRPNTSDLAGDETIIVSHGTAVAGLIGARGHNNALGAGLNWHVSLMNLKIVGNSGNGSLIHLHEAIRYAVDNGADVISMSVIGNTSDPTEIQSAIEHAYANDVVVVAAAGNALLDLGEQPLYPICADANMEQEMVIGVSAVHASRQFARFSNFGGDCVDITAPGVGVSSTVRFSPSAGLDTYYRGRLQGTSFAAPLVSGTAALIKSLYPELTAPQIIDLILSSTSKTPPEDEALYQSLFGAGLLQVDAAVSLAKERYGLPDMPTEQVMVENSLLEISAASVLQTTSSADLVAAHGDFTVTHDLAPNTLTLMRGGQYMSRWVVEGTLQSVVFDEVDNTIHVLVQDAGAYTFTTYTFFGAPIRSEVLEGSWRAPMLESTARGSLLLSDITGATLMLTTVGDLATSRWSATAYLYEPTRTTRLGSTFIAHGTSGESDVLVAYDGLGNEQLRRSIARQYGTVEAFGNVGDMVYTVHDEVVVFWNDTLDTVRITIR